MTHLFTTLIPRTWLLLVGLFVVGGALLLPEIAFAQDTFVDTPLKIFLYTVIVNLTGWMLWLGGTLLDYGVNTFVINFGLNFNSNGVGVAVNQLWVVVRDLFNILFIFGLVYIGFQMILNTDDSRTKSTLVSLIIAALLVNFSLFITKFVVDFSNTLAAEVAIAGFESGQTGIDQTAERVEIGNTFFGLMGVSQFLGITTELANAEVAPYSYIFGIGIINIIGAFAFGVGGIMLIIRFVVLSIYMVLSPFMFLGWVFPGFKNVSSKYWSGFFKQAFYAPVYIVMIFFAATILNNFFRGGGSMEGANIGSITGDNAIFVGQEGGNIAAFGGGLAPFILSAAFLIAAVQVAGKLAADGSGAMAKVTGAVNSRVRGAVRGGGRFAARNTAGYAAMGVGAGANKVANSRRYRQLNTALGNKWYTRDVAGGMDSALAGVGKASVAGSRTAAEQREYVQGRQNKVNATTTELKRQKEASQELTNARENNKDNATERAARQQAINALGGKVAKMTDAEILSQNKDILTDPAFAQHLTDAHIKALKESDQYDNAEIKSIIDSRNTASIDTLAETLDSNNATAQELNDTLDQLAQTIQRMPTERVQDLGIDKLKEQRVAAHLTDDQITDLEKSGRYNASQMGEIKKARKDALVAIANGHAPDLTNSSNPEQAVALTDRREKMFQGNAQTAGKLPADIFRNSVMAQYITPAALQQRVRNGLSNSEIQDVENNINNHISATGDIKVRKMWQKWSNNTTEGARFTIN